MNNAFRAVRMAASDFSNLGGRSRSMQSRMEQHMLSQRAETLLQLARRSRCGCAEVRRTRREHIRGDNFEEPIFILPSAERCHAVRELPNMSRQAHKDMLKAEEVLLTAIGGAINVARITTRKCIHYRDLRRRIYLAQSPFPISRAGLQETQCCRATMANLDAPQSVHVTSTDATCILPQAPNVQVHWHLSG
jgi:hypothetical protein